MKAQIRHWDNQEQKNYFISVDVVEGCNGISVRLDGVTLCNQHTNVADALADAEKIIRDRKIRNS